MEQITIYRSNAKLLITGEYLVLDGALALAVPLKVGQTMTIFEDVAKNHTLSWFAFDTKGLWFKAIIDIVDFITIETNNEKVSTTLVKFLVAAQEQNPDFLNNNVDYICTNNCNFDIDWGVGSSSTFISNLAFWANVNPYKLQSLVYDGSGYDIACARTNSPILYKLQDNQPQIINVCFSPAFSDKLYLIYLGQKQNTQLGIKHYKTSKMIDEHSIERISSITNEITSTSNIVQFMQLIFEHEQIISNILKVPTIKADKFKDFKGEIKSLGAWGGDFALIASEQEETYIWNYFRKKGFNLVLHFNEFVNLSENNSQTFESVTVVRSSSLI